jgi:hypothetical protein
MPIDRWRARGSWERSRLSEIDSPLIRTLPSQPLRRVFYFPKQGRSKFSGEAGTGDPDPGARARMRAPEARGLPEGTRRKPDTDGRANQVGFAMAAQSSERRDGIHFSIWFAASRGSTNAGGEDSTDIASSPAYPLQLSMCGDVYRQGGGEDVCYFVARRYGAERVRAPHAERRSPARAATASPVPRQPSHDPW